MFKVVGFLNPNPKVYLMATDPLILMVLASRFFRTTTSSRRGVLRNLCTAMYNCVF